MRLDPATGDLLPANATGSVSILKHLTGRWVNSPYIAIDRRSGRLYSTDGLRLDRDALDWAIKGGFATILKIWGTGEILEQIHKDEAALIRKIAALPPGDAATETKTGKNLAREKNRLVALKAMKACWPEDLLLIQGIVPAELLLHPGTPLSPEEIRSLRLKSLQRDPAHGYKIGKNSREEGEAGLELEEMGLIAAPLKRELTGLAEFTDGTGQAWDVKKFHAWEREERDFTVEKAVPELAEQMHRGEKVILNVVEMRTADILALRDAIEARGWGEKVLWYPAALTERLFEEA